MREDASIVRFAYCQVCYANIAPPLPRFILTGNPIAKPQFSFSLTMGHLKNVDDPLLIIPRKMRDCRRYISGGYERKARLPRLSYLPMYARELQLSSGAFL